MHQIQQVMSSRGGDALAEGGALLTRLRAVGHGVVDVVVPDRPQPGEEGAPFGERIAATAAHHLLELIHANPGARRRARAERYRVLAG